MRTLCIALLALGCGKSSTVAVDASFAGKSAKLTYGVARIQPDLGIYVVLSTHKVGCKFPSQLADEQRVAFTISNGPRDSYFVAGTSGIDLAFFSGAAGANLTVAPREVSTVDVEPFANDRVRGKLKVQWKPTEPAAGTYQASGSFDVLLCEHAQGAVAAPQIAGDHPARGTIAGAPYEVKGAIAWVRTERGVRHVSRLQLFPSANLNCGAATLRDGSETVITANAIGGASDVASHLGSPEPASAMVSRREKSDLKLEYLARTAIRFDKIDLQQGGTVSGSILATSAPDAPAGVVEGTFSARVCDEEAPPVTSKVAMTSTLWDAEKPLRYAKANVALDGLHLELSDQPITCLESGTWNHRIYVFLGTGPERAFFAGGPTRHYGTVEGKKTIDTVSIPVTLDLSPFVLEEGATVKGTISFDAMRARMPGDKPKQFSGKGTFETTICRDRNDGIATLRVHPKTVDATPVSGTVESEPFKLGSALLRDGALDLYEHGGVTCAKAANDNGPRLTLKTLALEAPPIVGRAQPAFVYLSKSEDTFGALQQAFVWLDEVDKAHVKGRLFATNSDYGTKTKWQIAGGFDATVCH